MSAAGETFDWDAWQNDFNHLPPGVQEPLKEWYALQAELFEALGVPEPQWYDVLTWALENPGDFTFIQELRRGKEAGDDGLDEHDEAERIRALAVGLDTHRQARHVDVPTLRDRGGDRGLSGDLMQRMVGVSMGRRRR